MRRKFHVLLSILLSGFLLWVLFRDTRWGEVFTAMRNAKTGWLLLYQATVWLSFFTRIERWKYIVRAVEPAVTFRQMFSATQIGFLANFTLPGRVGEIIRAFVLSRLARLSFSKSIAVTVLDRVTDLAGLIATLVVTVLAFRPTRDIILPPSITTRPIPKNIVQAGAYGTALFLGIVVAVLVLVYTQHGLAMRMSDRCVGLVSERAAQRVRTMIGHFAQGLHVFRSAGDMGKSLFFSLVTWGWFLAGSACMLAAFGFRWPWYTPFLMQSLIAVIISVPGAPGFVGQFHVALVVSLVMAVPNVDLATAKAFAIITHLAHVVPVALAGVYCLFLEKLSFVELARNSTRAQQEEAEKTE